MIERKGYYPEFDGLRALAALAVVLGHSGGGPESFLRQTHLASISVRFFFVLSGFLITGILLGMRDRVASRGSSPWEELRIFYIRRVLRIFPPYYLYLLAFVLIGNWFLINSLWWHVTYLSNFYPAFVGRLIYPVPHFWSLAVEEQFYLVWPFIVLFTPRNGLKPVLCLAIVSAVIFRFWASWNGPDWDSLYLPFACLDCLGLGGLAAVLLHDSSATAQKILGTVRSFGAWIGVPVVVFSVVLASAHLGMPMMYITAGLFATGVASCAILLCFTGENETFLARLLRSKPLRYLGQISYGIYIFHLPFLSLYTKLMTQLGWSPTWQGRFAFTLVCTLAVASASWYLVERPLLNLKRFFTYREKHPEGHKEGTALLHADKLG